MRIQIKEAPKNGDQRTCKGFLLFPKTIGKEIRWLEEASWAQEYVEAHEYAGWVDKVWVD